MIAVFLESMITCAITSPEGSVYYRHSAGGVCLTAPPLPIAFNGLFRQPAAVSRLCPCVSGVPPVPQTDTGSWVEYTKALRRLAVKELGKMTP